MPECVDQTFTANPVDLVAHKRIHRPGSALDNDAELGGICGELVLNP